MLLGDMCIIIRQAARASPCLSVSCGWSSIEQLERGNAHLPAWGNVARCQDYACMAQRSRERNSVLCTTRERSGKMPRPVVASATISEKTSANNRVPSAEVLRLWREVEAVCFDVDSTVCTDEGIDELAAFCGAGEAVAEWTRRAMGGSVPFEEALAARLSLIQPSLDDIRNFLSGHPPRLSPGIQELFDNLRANGKDVYLVSGGFRFMIEPVADILGIPHSRIFANTLRFNKDDGKYSGFDDREFTSRSGGKAEAVAAIKKEHGYSLMAMVGDGATDMEARRPGGADLFVGYGGVQSRKAVEEGADWFVLDLTNLLLPSPKQER